MRHWLLLLTLALGLVLLPTGMAATTGIMITSTGFHPSAVTIAFGDTATWTNEDKTKHQVVADDGSFSSPVLSPKQIYSHAFKIGGTFTYHDGLHPALKGSVTVIPARTVWIMSNGFVPPTMSIRAGQTVTWVNKTDANQQVIADDGSFVSLVLAPGAKYAHTFSTAGSFGYHDGLQPAIKGTVIVTAPPPGESITLDTNATAVTYAGTATLAGNVVNGTAGEKVTITADPQTVAGKTFKSTQTVTADTNGDFSATVQPLIHTVYVASTGKSTSDPLAINVRPRLRLGLVSRTRAIVRAYAVRSFFHKFGYLQVFRSRAGVWSSIARFRFTSAVNSVSPTVITRASFRFRVRHGLRLRVLMPFNQTRPGYISGFSNSVRS